jgi:phosphoglycolate phosphatase-like HAD superfamily hydrolase
MMPALAPIFYSLYDSFLDKIPLKPQPNIVEVIDDLIRGGNGIVVVSSLPRPLAVKALRKSRLSTLFEGRVSPDNLITLTEYEQVKLKKREQLL